MAHLNKGLILGMERSNSVGITLTIPKEDAMYKYKKFLILAGGTLIISLLFWQYRQITRLNAQVFPPMPTPTISVEKVYQEELRRHIANGDALLAFFDVWDLQGNILPSCHDEYREELKITTDARSQASKIGNSNWLSEK